MFLAKPEAIALHDLLELDLLLLPNAIVRLENGTSSFGIGRSLWTKKRTRFLLRLTIDAALREAQHQKFSRIHALHGCESFCGDESGAYLKRSLITEHAGVFRRSCGASGGCVRCTSPRWRLTRVHVIVFVIGSLLTQRSDLLRGLSLHAAANHWWAKVWRLLKPLLRSCLMMVVCFSLLLPPNFQ